MERVLVALAATMVLLGACADEGGGGDATGATRAPVSTAVPAAPTTATTVAPPLTPLPTGEEAVDALLERWRAGDRPGALQVASATAVDALFAIAPETGQARGCNAGGANINVSCVFRLGAGELQVRAAPTADGAGFVVDFVILGS
jgi:hypothetical protein